MVYITCIKNTRHSQESNTQHGAQQHNTPEDKSWHLHICVSKKETWEPIKANLVTPWPFSAGNIKHQEHTGQLAKQRTEHRKVLHITLHHKQ